MTTDPKAIIRAAAGKAPTAEVPTDVAHKLRVYAELCDHLAELRAIKKRADALEEELAVFISGADGPVAVDGRSFTVSTRNHTSVRYRDLLAAVLEAVTPEVREAAARLKEDQFTTRKVLTRMKVGEAEAADAAGARLALKLVG